MKHSLIRQFAPEVRQFCREHLAGILYSCVEHPEPRFDIDGNTAQLAIREYIDNGGLSILSGLTTKFLVTSVYQEVRISKPHMQELDLDVIVSGGLFSPEVLAVSERLSFLTDSEFESLITCIPANQRRTYQEQFLGKDVFQLFYKRLKYERLFLNSQGYGRINFH